MNRKDEFAELLKDWTPPSELRRSTPREVELTAGGVAVMVLAFACLAGAVAAGVLLGSRVVADEERVTAVEQQGRDADALITRLWRTGDNGSRRRVAYTFEWEGRVYKGQADVPRQTFAELSQGDSLAIRFVPSRPEWNHPGAWPDRPMPVAVPIACSLLLVGLSGLIVFSVRRQKQLIEEGKPAPAVIVQSKKEHTGPNGGSRTVLRYEFPLPGGSTAKGRAGAPKRGGQIGAVLCALYLPENPRRNALYPLDLARPGE